MILGEWHDRGLDVSALVDQQMHRPAGATLLHGDLDCAAITPNAPTTTEAATLTSELCEACWHQGHSQSALPVIGAIRGARALLDRHRWALSSTITAAGFPVFLTTMQSLHNLTDFYASLPGGLFFVEELKSQFLFDFEQALGDRTATQNAVCAQGAACKSLAALGPETLLVRQHPRTVAGEVFLSDDAPIMELISPWWVPEHTAGVAVFRAPAEVIEFIAAELIPTDRHGNNLSSQASLLPSDTSDIIHTALSLLDPDSSALCTLEAVLATARKVHKTPGR